MKALRSLIGFSLVLILNSGARAVAPGDAPKLVNIALTTAYVPIGFDDNDRAQIVVSGSFNNACYKMGPYSIDVNETEKTIQVRQKAYSYTGMCLQVVIKFNQVVELGILKSGTYTVIDAVTHEKLGVLPIKVASQPTADDYLYAPVSIAYVNEDQTAIVLQGSFTDSCMHIKDVLVDYQARVIVVQPIAEQRKGESCREGDFPFTHKVPLERQLPKPYLLHVRSMNGNALNVVIDYFK